MKYYYLNGIDKLGPYTFDEIKSRNLNSDTMIFREDKSNWFPLSEFDELNIPVLELIDTAVKEVPETELINEPVIDDIKIKLPKHTIVILFIVASIGIAALITNFQQKSDYKKINDDLDLLFKGKTSISDYYCSDRLDGMLYDVVYHTGEKTGRSSFPKFSDYVTANNIILDSEPFKSSIDKDDYRYNKDLKQWDKFKNLKQYYIKSKYYEGFMALNLQRSDDVFTIVTYFGGDMAYKVPEKIHRSGTNYGYFSTPGYDIPTYRPSIKNCYIGAAEFLTKEDKDSTYVNGSYSKISGFKSGLYKSNFYEINQLGDKYFEWDDTIHVLRPNGERSFVINDDKITSSTSRNDGSVFNSDWIVWYKSYYNQYSLEQKKWAFYKYWSIYSVIGIFITMLIFFFIKNRKRFVIE